MRSISLRAREWPKKPPRKRPRIYPRSNNSFEDPRALMTERRKNMRVSLALVTLMVGLGLVVVALPVQAHHAFAATFDTTKPVVVHRGIPKVDLNNPHSWFWCDGKATGGTLTRRASE